MRHFIALFSIVALLLASACTNEKAAGPGGGMMMPTPSVRTVAATTSDVPLTIAAVGNVEAMASVDVKSRVGGEILRVTFEEGQQVQKGELLFEIDPEPLQRQIAQIQADITKDTAMEQQARANVSKDEAQLKQTSAAAQRGRELSKAGIISREQTEQVVATDESAQATLTADRAGVESAVAALKSDRARLAQTELQLSYTKVTAPITGRAGAIAVKAGNIVSENTTTLVTILQISPIYVTFGVPEQVLPEVRRFNAESPLAVTASPDGSAPETGTLRFIDNSVDTTTGTIKLKAEFGNSARVLWPGEFVNVNARLSLERDRITVPNRTVQTGPQGKYVWVVNKGDATVRMQPVQVLRTFQGDNGLDTAVIGSGLNAGELVVSEGQMRLAPGIRVQFSDAQTAANAGSQTPGGGL